jgi:hypothetical protein
VITVFPLRRKIGELEERCPILPLWYTSLPGTNESSLELQERSKTLDLACLNSMVDQLESKKQGKTQPKKLLTEDTILRILVSLAPTLVQRKRNILDDEKHEWDQGSGEIEAHIGGLSPYAMEAELLASCALYLAQIEDRRLPFNHDNRYDIMRSACYVRKLAEVMKPYFMQYLNLSTFLDIERFVYELSARIIIVAYLDLDTSEDGFFGVLLRSVFARVMTPDAREQWEEYLGLNHKIARDSLEDLNPFISVHRSALASSEKWGLEYLKNEQADDRTMKVTEPRKDSYRRFTQIQHALHAEADYNHSLFTAFHDATALPSLKEFLSRIPHNSMVYQPEIHRKRARGAKTTVPEDGATSMTKKPKVAPNMPTKTRTTTGTSSPLAKIAASGSKRKAAAAAAPNPSNPDPPTQNTHDNSS